MNYLAKVFYNNKITKSLRFIFLIGLIIVGILTNIVLHEFGHCLPAIYKGGSINRIVVLGYEIIPNIGMKTHFGLVAFASPNWASKNDPDNYWKGITKLSGAAFTLFVSFISVIVLLLIKPKRLLRYLLLIPAFGFLDIFTYSFLELFGLPHRLIVGRIYAEPIEGMMQMGFSKTISLLLVLFFVSVVVYLLVNYLKNYLPK